MSPLDDEGHEPRGGVNSGRTQTPSRPPVEQDGEFWGEPVDDADSAPTDGSGPGHRRRRRRRTFIALGIVLLPIILVLGAGAWFLYQLNPPGDPGKRVSVDVPRRTGNAAIGDLLEDKGVIGSSQAFQIYVGVTRAGPFDPGHYKMRETLGVRDAVNVLKSGPAKGAEFQLTLPPGLTLAEVADRVGTLPRPHPRRVPPGGAVRSRAFEVPAGGRDVPRRAAVPRHVLRLEGRDR